MKITKSQLRQIIKEEFDRLMTEKEKKKDCFEKGLYKTFAGKSKCIQSTKGLSKERADAYVASVLRDMGEIKEVKDDE